MNPEQVREFFSSYTIYTITSPLIKGGVKRRYSDFDWMRTILVARFHGMAVPLLPEKRVVGNTGDAFVEERRRGLAHWLQMVVANPYLRHDHTLRLFMTVQTPMEWEQAKRAAASGTGSNPAENEGLGQWFGCLRHYPIPADHERAVAEVSADLNEAEADLVQLLQSVTEYYEASKRMTNALKGVRAAIQGVAGHAEKRSAAACDTLAPSKEHLALLARVSKQCSQGWMEAAEMSGYCPNEVQLFLMDAVIKEIQRTRSGKALIAVRESAKAAYARSWEELDRLQFQEKQARDKGQEAYVKQLVPQIKEKEQLTKQLKERLDDVTKGVLLYEARAVTVSRLRRLKQAFGSFAALQVASGSKQEQIWNKFLGAARMTHEGMAEVAQKVLGGNRGADDTVGAMPVAPGAGDDRALAAHAAAGGTSDPDAMAGESDFKAAKPPTGGAAPAPAPAAGGAAQGGAAAAESGASAGAGAGGEGGESKSSEEPASAPAPAPAPAPEPAPAPAPAPEPAAEPAPAPAPAPEPAAADPAAKEDDEDEGDGEGGDAAAAEESPAAGGDGEDQGEGDGEGMGFGGAEESPFGDAEDSPFGDADTL